MLTLVLDTTYGGPVAYATGFNGVNLAQLGMRFVNKGIVPSFSIGPEEPLTQGDTPVLLSYALAELEGRTGVFYRRRSIRKESQG